MLWGDKPYNSLNYELKKEFSKKIAKISIDGGFTCPNRDGKVGYGGCIFCSSKGSGDFAESRKLSIKEQIKKGKEQTSKKWKDTGYIAYFQSYTNTYAPIDELRKKYYEAIECDDICGIAIATRPDCLPFDVLELLSEINQKTYIWVELGFQTSNENSAKFINRCYDNSVFEYAIKELKKRNIKVVVHTIMGLPNETKEDMLNTVKYVCSFNIDGIKLQLLHVLSDSKLYEYYKENKFHILDKEEYTDIIIEAIENIPENIVIHRITGDGSKENLIEPLWSLDKRGTLNLIHKKMREKHSFQGKNLKNV